jgi:predicted nucleic acid-binding protein
MNFWDSSAVVPLVVEEKESAGLRTLLRGDKNMVVWWGTPVECHAAVRRRAREPGGESEAWDSVLAGLSALSARWFQVEPSDRLRLRAERLLAQHALRAADALQLAAALDWADEEPLDKSFVCLDDRLSEAARREGFRILPARAMKNS